MFIIKDGSEKDIQPGDFVECLGQQMPYDPEDGWEYEVLDIDDAAQLILCDLVGEPGWVDATLVDHVWRKI